jgi:hypothetical protein
MSFNPRLKTTGARIVRRAERASRRLRANADDVYRRLRDADQRRIKIWGTLAYISGHASVHEGIAACTEDSAGSNERRDRDLGNAVLRQRTMCQVVWRPAA